MIRFFSVFFLSVLCGVAGTLGIDRAVVTPLPRTVLSGDKYLLVGVLQPINTMKSGRYSVTGRLGAEQLTAPRIPNLSISSQTDGSLSINWESSPLFPFMAPQFTDGGTSPVWGFGKYQMTPSGGRMTVQSNLIKQSQLFRLVTPQ